MIELQGVISQEGKLQVFNQPVLNQWRIANAGKNIVLSLKLKRKGRSTPQNAYYWAVVVPLIREAINKFGNEFDEAETHEFLKAKFNSIEIEPVPDNFIEVPQSTGKLDTVGFMTYIEKIQRFASQMLGVYIPAPNEAMTIDFPEQKQIEA